MKSAHHDGEAKLIAGPQSFSVVASGVSLTTSVSLDAPISPPAYSGNFAMSLFQLNGEECNPLFLWRALVLSVDVNVFLCVSIFLSSFGALSLSVL